jgi:hypothetical protein
MKIQNINFDLSQGIEDLASEMDGMSYIDANSCRIIEFTLPDGRLVQAQLVLQTDEYEFIGEE